MSIPQDVPSGSPPAVSSAHQEAAAAAVSHLDAAVQALQGAYDHPHFADRLAAVGSHVASLKGVIGHMPEEEDSRAEYAGRLLAAHNTRQLDYSSLPDHAIRLLDQELERIR